ncbi:MAG: hypothetical protein ACREK6_06570, partial [Candidatus Rokuibacteriota bacterium]
QASFRIDRRLEHRGTTLTQRVTLHEMLSQMATLREESASRATATERLMQALGQAQQEREHVRGVLCEHETRWTEREAELEQLASLLVEREAQTHEQRNHATSLQ